LLGREKPPAGGTRFPAKETIAAPNQMLPQAATKAAVPSGEGGANRLDAEGKVALCSGRRSAAGFKCRFSQRIAQSSHFVHTAGKPS